MKKIDIAQLLRNGTHFNGVGQLVKATHSIQRTLGIQPIAMPGQPVAPSPTAPVRPRWNKPAANDVEDAVVVDRSPQPAGSFTRITLRHGHDVRHYKLFVPTTASAGTPLPLVVMLHGCTQTPDDFALGTGMNAAAAEAGAIVLYPAQAASANPKRCWNWFRPEDAAEGPGEAALLADLTRLVLATENVDPDRIYVAGLSAGGAQAMNLAARFPELFAAAGVHSGLAAGAAQDVMSAFSAMRGGAPGAPTARPVRTIVFHGDADRTVHPANAEAVAAQAVAAAGALQLRVEEGEAGGRSYSRALRRNRRGETLCETWTIHGAGHAWSGGDPAGSYAEAEGPNATREMLRFFLDG